MSNVVDEYIQSLKKGKKFSYPISRVLVEAYIAKKQNEDKHEYSYNEFGASSAGSCLRKRYYDKLIDDKKSRHSLSTQKIFLIGTIFHDFFQEHIFVGGQKEVRKKFEVGEIIIRCDADYIDEAVIWEVKTVSSVKYISEEPNINNVKQLNLYLGTFGRSLGKLVYIDKRFFTIIEHDVIFSKKLFDEVINEYLKLWNHIKKLELPEKEEDYISCKRCHRKDLCKVNENVSR